MASIKIGGEIQADEKAWWNKIQNMNDRDLELLPDSFMKKYGSFITKWSEWEKFTHDNENKNFMGRASEVKFLKDLQTNEEKAVIEAHK